MLDPLCCLALARHTSYSSQAVLDTTTMNIEENLPRFAIEAIIGALSNVLPFYRETRHVFTKDSLYAIIRTWFEPEKGCIKRTFGGSGNHCFRWSGIANIAFPIGRMLWVVDSHRSLRSRFPSRTSKAQERLGNVHAIAYYPNVPRNPPPIWNSPQKSRPPGFNHRVSCVVM